MELNGDTVLVIGSGADRTSGAPAFSPARGQPCGLAICAARKRSNRDWPVWRVPFGYHFGGADGDASSTASTACSRVPACRWTLGR